MIITNDYEVAEIAKDIESYEFNSPIEVDSFVELMNCLEPKDYYKLITSFALSNVKDELPDYVVQTLVDASQINRSSSCLNYENISAACQLSTDTNQIMIDENDFDIEELIKTQKSLTLEQFIKIVKTGNYISGDSLGQAVGESGKVEFALYVVRNKEEFRDYINITDFKSSLYDSFGYVVLSEQEELELFGFNRPSLSSEELRSYEPCGAGWKRVMSWAKRTDVKYSWNEFIIRHIIANKEESDSAISDLTWLASVMSEEHEYF